MNGTECVSLKFLAYSFEGVYTFRKPCTLLDGFINSVTTRKMTFRSTTKQRRLPVHVGPPEPLPTTVTTRSSHQEIELARSLRGPSVRCGI